MATLAQIYGTVKQICFKDEKGVYLDNEKVALDNGVSNGYIRRNGQKTLDKIGADIYDVSLPLKFVGAVPNANPLDLEEATTAALIDLNCNIEIVSQTIDKQEIAESEGIEIEKLSHFDGVAMVMIEYIIQSKEIFNPKCDYDFC